MVSSVVDDTPGHRAREPLDRHAWGEAYEVMTEADRTGVGLLLAGASSGARPAIGDGRLGWPQVARGACLLGSQRGD